ncbi:MAG TPA: hydroxysqualene dehydroxylase HpnE [Acidimicrobiales bacterium]|nr:hydroxysqualene dehydroxylase HpnE [Acidimicrobiales bacterium]
MTVTSGRVPQVAVVGGGLAGISAALACADAGAAVALFEKRKHLGGLTWSFSHDGLSMDNGQHVFLRCCTAYLDFLGRIGSAGDVELQDRLDLTVLRPGTPLRPGVARASLRRDRVRAPLHLARSLFGYGVIPFSARARFASAALALSRLDLNDPALDEDTFEAWLVRHGQGPEAIAGLWDLICLPTVNLPASEASLAMAAKVFQTGLLRESSAGDIGWSRVPLGSLHGERAATALGKAGVAVHLGEAVEQVRRGESGFTVQTADGEAAADGVVVALPHYSAESVLPPGALPRNVRPSELASSPIVNVHVHFDRRVTDLPLVAGIGTVAQWVFDRTASSGAAAGQYLAVSISAADNYVGARPGELGDQVTEALRDLFPRAKDAKVLSTFVTKELHATFRASPGSSAHRASTRTLLPGLVLAGAWTATGWPPTMESAVRSGVSAARAVLVAAGQRSGLPPLSSDRLQPGKLQEVM